MKSSNLVWVKGIVRARYEKTFSLEVEGERHFLPYSQLKSHSEEELEVGEEMEIAIPRWLAEDRGLG